MFEILSIICVLITFTHYVEYTGCKLKKQTGIFFIHKGKEMIGIEPFRRRKSYEQNKMLELCDLRWTN